MMASVPDAADRPRPEVPRWTFLTHHAQVLLVVAADHTTRVADIATRVGISERATLTILADLEESGYLTRERVGRRPHYRVTHHRPLRHPEHRGHDIDELIAVLRPQA
jgi:DNA-binding Lrp family transcriptional regulator